MKLGSIRKQLLMGALALMGSGVGVGAFASVSGASPSWGDPGTGGTVEICKVSAPAPLAVSGNFTFTVSNAVGSPTVTVAVGKCSGPIAVTGSSSTIVETGAPWFQVTSITQQAGGSYLTAPTAASLAARTAVVSVTPTTTSTVTFTDALVNGTVEVCKYPAAGSGLTGNFQFNLTEQLNSTTSTPGFSTSVTIPVNSCSAPITVPAGTVTSTEAGTNLYVTSIQTNFAGNSASSATVGTANLVNGTVSVTVKPSLDPTVQTLINYTDNVVGYKVCKAAFVGVEPGGASTTFPFTFAFTGVTVNGVVGTSGTLPAISLAAGQCQVLGTFRAGTTITTTEGIVAGTKVGDIENTSALSTVTGSTSLPNRTTTVVLGTATTSGAAAPGNEGITTFTNIPALPGQMKICKFSGANGNAALNPIGTTFNITVSGPVESATGVVSTFTGTYVVNLGGCTAITSPTFVDPTLNPAGNVPFMFNSNVSVTEAASGSATAANVVSSITSASLTNVTVVEGGVNTPTNEPVITGFGAMTANATIGEAVLTEVDVFNIDPPIVTGSPAPVVSTGTGVVVTAPVANTTSTVSNSGVVGATSTTSGLTVPTIIKSLTPAQKKAELKALNKSLANVKSAIVRENKLIAKAHGKALSMDKARLKVLKAQEALYNKEIKNLK